MACPCARARPRTGACLAFLLALSSLASRAIAQQASDLGALERWLTAKHGKFRAKTCYSPAGLRGLCSAVDAKPGEPLIELPADELITCNDLKECTYKVYRHRNDSKSPLAPYLAMLPAPGNVLCRCNMPAAALPLLQSDWLEADVLRVQRQLPEVLERLRKEYGSNVTLADVQHTCAVAYTRTIWDASRDTNVMMPFIDLLNHRRYCPHMVETWDVKTDKPHPPLSASLRVPKPEEVKYVLVAGAAVKAGEELCFSYSDHARDDTFLLSWGFLPPLGPNHPPQPLSVDDWQVQSRVRGLRRGSVFPALPDELPDTPYTGSGSALITELQRIDSLLHTLTTNRVHTPSHAHSRDAGVGAGGNAEAGTGKGGGGGGGGGGLSGHVLELVTELQRRRRAALRFEVDRLRHLLLEDERREKEFWHTLDAVWRAGLAVIVCGGVLAGLLLAVEALVSFPLGPFR